MADEGYRVLADFTALNVAISGALRDPETGRFPKERDESLFPLTEYLRQGVISTAVARELPVLATNSDGDPTRRQKLLGLLGAGAVEQIVDPGRQTVIERLRDPDGSLSGECASAINRWYGAAR